MDPPEGCVLYLSCTYAGVLLAVLLTLFLTCIAIYYLERRQRARFPDLPDGRLVVESPSPHKAAGVAARVLSDSVLQDARVQPRSTVHAPQAAPSTTFSSRGLPPRPPIALQNNDNAEKELMLNRRRQQALREEEAVLERSMDVPRTQLGKSSENGDNGDNGAPLSVGMEVLVVATDDTRGWCGRLDGQQQAWFCYSDPIQSRLKLSPGDVVTVVGRRLDSWCGACRGMTANFTLPADSVGRVGSGWTPGASFAPSPYSALRH